MTPNEFTIVAERKEREIERGRGEVLGGWLIRGTRGVQGLVFGRRRKGANGF